MTQLVFAGAETTRPRTFLPGLTESFDSVSWLTLYMIVLFAIPSRLVIGPLGSAGAVSMVLGLGSLGLWVLTALLRTEPAAVLRPQPIRWALGAFIFCVGLSYVMAMSLPINSDEMSPADVAILSLLSWSGTTLLAADGIPSRKRLDTLIWRFVLCGGLMGVLGIAQFFTKRAVVDLISVPGLTPVSEAIVYLRNGLVRPTGTAIHPIEFGAIMAMILPLALYVALRHRDRPLVLRWFPAVAIAAVIGMSSSRSAYLGAIVAVAVCMVAWTARERRRFLIAVVAGIAVAAVAMPRLVTSIVNLFAGAEEDPSISSRTDSFSFAEAFIVQHPLFGRGLGTFLPKYRIFDNQYLGMLVSIGLVGTIALIALAVVAIGEMVRAYRDGPVGSDELATALAGGILAGFVSLAFFDAFAFPMTMGTLFLLIGMAAAFAKMSRRPLPF